MTVDWCRWWSSGGSRTNPSPGQRIDMEGDKRSNFLSEERVCVREKREIREIEERERGREGKREREAKREREREGGKGMARE